MGRGGGKKKKRGEDVGEESGYVLDSVVGAFASDWKKKVMLVGEWGGKWICGKVGGGGCDLKGREEKRRGKKILHIVIACAASPITVTFPSRLSHMSFLGIKSSSTIALAIDSSGIFVTQARKGSAQSSARVFINLILSLFAAGTSNGSSIPMNPARYGQLIKIWHS